MIEKTPSKYLENLEKQFAYDNPVLQQAAKVFKELDQIEYDLGLIEMEESTACKQTWWPVITLIGGNSTAKAKFINSYLGSDSLTSGIQTSTHKFTILLHSSQNNPAILPASAVDVDPRYPFYQVSRKIEQQQAGEGSRINSYLELKAFHTDGLKGKLFIDTPNMMTVPITPVVSMMLKQSIENSDLVFVFIDVFEQSTPLGNELLETMLAYQDNNKFIYLIEESANLSNSENISQWQIKLSLSGLDTGQFIVLSKQSEMGLSSARYFAELEQRMANVGHDRSYRVLEGLEKSIHDIENIIAPEVKQSIELWKDRVNITTLISLSFIVILAIVAEVEIGILEFLIDPIIGPVMLAILIAVMVPLHILGSRLQAKLISNKLIKRQHELCLVENLAGMFEKNLTVFRMIFPITEPAGWNKKTKLRLGQLSDKTKQLVQTLNDRFSSYNDSSSTQASDSQN